jgi:hypothetical protein
MGNTEWFAKTKLNWPKEGRAEYIITPSSLELTN